MSAPPRVVEASLRSFVCGYGRYEEAPFRLGQLVAVREGAAAVLGVVAEIESGPEDPTRPLQPRGLAGQSGAEVLAGEPGLRELLRTRLTLVSCGYIEGESARATLPPVPPPLFGAVEPAAKVETIAVAGDGAFLAALVASPLCDDAVIGAAVRLAAPAFAPAEQAFTIAAGKELARLLRADPARLTSILREVAR